MSQRRCEAVRVALLGGIVASLTIAQSGMVQMPNTTSWLQGSVSTALTPPVFTIEAWFLFNPSLPGGNNVPTIAEKGYTWSLSTSSQLGGNLRWIVKTNGYNIVTTPIPILQWHHVAGTFDGSIIRMYLDGIEVGFDVCDPGPLDLDTSTPLRVGRGLSASETWRGYLDEIRVWNVVRSQADIDAYRFKRLDSRPGLVAAWHFDGSFLDLTGGFNLTAMGTPAILPSTSPVLLNHLTTPALAPIGQPLTFDVYIAPPLHSYFLELSTTGTMPGTPLPPPLSGTFPLNPPLLYQAFGAALPTVFLGFVGLTGADGRAFPVLNLPAEPALIGIPLSAAFAIMNPAAPASYGGASNPTVTTMTAMAPVVLSLSPQTGPTEGSWLVSIDGQHFQTGASVLFDGVSATNVVTVNPGLITCLTPPGSLGPANLQVINPDGLSAFVPGAFTYVPTLHVTSASPPLGPAGATVTVSGSGFQPGLAATLGGTPLTPGGLSSTSFSFTIPAGVACNSQLAISLPDGQTDSLPFNLSPVVTGLIGQSGLASGGAQFFLLGANFYPGTTVTVGGNPAQIFSATTSIILAVAPPGSPGPAPIAVTSTTGCSGFATYIYY